MRPAPPSYLSVLPRDPQSKLRAGGSGACKMTLAAGHQVGQGGGAWNSCPISATVTPCLSLLTPEIPVTFPRKEEKAEGGWGGWAQRAELAGDTDLHGETAE